jgi:hypothetical protein
MVRKYRSRVWFTWNVHIVAMAAAVEKLHQYSTPS